MSHTPGPWSAKHNPVTTRLDALVYTGDHLICKMPDPVYDNQHQATILANARLIAAAPELLALAEEFELLLEELKSVDGIDLQSTAMKVKSALMRAKGQI